MSAETLCEQLMQATEETERNTLLEEAAATAECFLYLMDTARLSMGEDFADALKRAQWAVLLAERRGELREEAQAGRLAGQILRVQGNHAGAAEALATAATRAKQAGDERLAAQVEIGRIDSLGWLGRYDEALKLARRLEKELRGHGEEAEAAKVLVNRGALHYRRDQFAAALSCYERALETLTQQGDAAAQAKLQANMAAVLMEMHRVEEAIALFEQARAAFAAQQMLSAAAMIDANVGFLHYLSGRYVQAVAALQRAREEFAQRGQTLEAAKCDADSADAYRELNLHPEALDAYTRAIQEFETLHVDYERARAELGRATVCTAAGQDAEASAGLERAADLFQQHRNTTQQARVRLLRAHMHRKEGRIEEAGREARQAAQTLKRSGLHGWAAEARFLLADMALEAGEDVSRQLQAIRRAANRYARGWLECRAQRALGQHYLRRGKTARALRYLRAGIETLEQARTLIAPEEMHVSFLRDKLAVYEEVVAALLSRGGPQDIAEALEYVERAKSRLLLERMQATVEERLAATELSPRRRDRMAELRAELSRSYHRLNAVDEGESRRLGTAGTAEVTALSLLEEEYRVLLQAAELANARTARGVPALPTVVRAEKLADSLRDSEALVEYYTVGGSVCAWIVTPEKIEYRCDIAAVDEVNHLARKLRYQLRRMAGTSEFSSRHARRFHADAQDVLRQLYDLLLRPIASRLAAEKLVVVPHGALHGLPLHALFDGTEYALDRWEFLYAPSAAIWHRASRFRQSPAKEAALALPLSQALVIGVQTPGIEQVAEEIQQIASLLPEARVLRQGEATLEAFRSLAGHSRLLHLATHALYRADNPLFSGLLLSDGWLLARDLYELTLNCDLATLSACQTGVTAVKAGDELFGLVRGFLAAGARSVAASLWPADDQATAFLMAHFYRLMGEGASKAAALRAAQKQTRELYPHPYHWAAFTLVGER